MVYISFVWLYLIVQYNYIQNEYIKKSFGGNMDIISQTA